MSDPLGLGAGRGGCRGSGRSGGLRRRSRGGCRRCGPRRGTCRWPRQATPACRDAGHGTPHHRQGVGESRFDGLLAGAGVARGEQEGVFLRAVALGLKVGRILRTGMFRLFTDVVEAPLGRDVAGLRQRGANGCDVGVQRSAPTAALSTHRGAQRQSAAPLRWSAVAVAAPGDRVDELAVVLAQGDGAGDVVDTPSPTPAPGSAVGGTWVRTITAVRRTASSTPAA
jgi:hypothetical protein